MVSVGIIGFGKMGKIRAKVILDTGKGEVISIFDPDKSADFENYQVADNADAIINNTKIDAVIICTPNYLNKPLTIKGLMAGKHIFCEKPPALNAPDVEEIREAERISGKKLMFGFNHRHHASIKHIKFHIDSGKFGKVLWMRGRYGKSVDQSFYETWRSQKKSAGGGILIDQGIHMLDLFLYLGGNFDDVRAFVSNLYWKSEIEDNVFAILRNSKTGVVASLHSTMTQWRHLFSLEIFLERGYMVLNGLKTSSGTYGDEVLSIAKNRSKAPASTWEDEDRTTYNVDHSWKSEMDHFFNAIIENEAIEIGTSSDALVLMKTLDEIYKQGNI